jgi:hypothetical protein
VFGEDPGLPGNLGFHERSAVFWVNAGASWGVSTQSVGVINEDNFSFLPSFFIWFMLVFSL